MKQYVRSRRGTSRIEHATTQRSASSYSMLIHTADDCQIRYLGDRATQHALSTLHVPYTWGTHLTCTKTHTPAGLLQSQEGKCASTRSKR